MKFCVYGGLGDTLNKQRRKPNGYPGALLADIIRNVWPDAATLPEGTPARPLQQPVFEWKDVPAPVGD